MKRTYFSLIFAGLFALFFSGTVSAQKNIIDKGEDVIKMASANQMFLRGDVNRALNLYKEVLSGNPNGSEVNFRVGECYFALGLIEDAKEHFEKAKKSNAKAHSEIDYYLGRVYHMTDELDKAIEYYSAFKKDNEGKSKDYGVDRMIANCEYAKVAMQKPVPVKITNTGDLINSTYDDKGPYITADGKTLVFTTRRPAPKGKSKVDKEGDFKYFEDIYMSKWDDAKNMWTEAEIIKGSVNSDGHDAVVSISPDGKQIFIYRNNESDAVGGEIFVSKVQQSGKWGAPKKLPKPISSTYVENGACISPDGNTLYFVSERPKQGEQKGYGHGDIWMSTKINKTDWGPPVNLGPEINTPEDEGGIFLHPDGKTLFFTSRGHEGLGNYDIYMTRMENGKWSKPVNLGYPINTTRNDMSFVLTTDNNTAYFASDRPGGMGERDIYTVDMSNYYIMGTKKEKEKGIEISILRGRVIITESGKGTEAKVTITDKETGQKVGETNSADDGDYFFTLKGNKNYIITVEKEDYPTVTEEFKLPVDPKVTFTMHKNVLLSKPKKK
jgi:hypothetical protein